MIDYMVSENIFGKMILLNRQYTRPVSNGELAERHSGTVHRTSDRRAHPKGLTGDGSPNGNKKPTSNTSQHLPWAELRRTWPVVAGPIGPISCSSRYKLWRLPQAVLAILPEHRRCSDSPLATLESHSVLPVAPSSSYSRADPVCPHPIDH